MSKHNSNTNGFILKATIKPSENQGAQVSLYLNPDYLSPGTDPFITATLPAAKRNLVEYLNRALWRDIERNRPTRERGRRSYAEISRNLPYPLDVGGIRRAVKDVRKLFAKAVDEAHLPDDFRGKILNLILTENQVGYYLSLPLEEVDRDDQPSSGEGRT